MHSAYSFIKEGNLNLDEFEDKIIENEYYGIEQVNGHYYNYFPPGTTFMTVPFVFAANVFLSPGIEKIPFIKNYVQVRSRKAVYTYDVIGLYHGVELFTASFLMALACVFVFKISKLYLDNIYSLFTTFVFAFCTSVYSVASRGLWSHGPVILILVIVLYMLLKAKEKNSLISYVSIPLFYSFLVRPSSIVTIIVISIYVFIYYRKYFSKYFLYGSIVVILFFVYNLSIYGTVLPSYYGTERLGIGLTSLQAIFANLISPSRGIFIFSPVLILSIAGVFYKLKHNKDPLDKFLIAIIILHLLVVSSFSTWWAGLSYGPRFMSDMLPLFIYFFIFGLKWILQMQASMKKACLALLIILTLTSFLIHFKGATSREAWTVWSEFPVPIHEQPMRVWDWRDMQFMR
ncbi:MAG TPA: hypothetical protein VHP32_01560 [Ignavibacteria bacterium]|nr:hypothetical protein [Ignavibacteria bacterium]